MEELRVSIIADASGLAPGLADATAQVQASATTMAEAQTIATQATQNLAAAQAQLGSAAVAGNAQAKAILVQYETELAAAKAQVQQLTTAETQQASSVASLAASTEKATAATAEFAVVQRAASAATEHAVPQVAAASGALRELEGNLPIRAAERFLTTTLGLGPVLQAAFPIVGAIAMGGVVADLVEGIVKLSGEAMDLSEELGIGWLDGAVAQLTGVGDKVKELDKEILGFQQHAHQYAEQTAEVGLSITGQKFGSAAEATQRSLAAQSEAQAIRTSIPLMQERLRIEKEVASYQGFSKVDLAHYGEQGRLRTEAQNAGVTTKPNLAVKEAEDTQAYINQQLSKIDLLEEQARELALKAGEVGKPADKKNKTDNLPQEIARAQIEAAHATDAELPPAQKITAELLKQVELNEIRSEYSQDGTEAERATLLALQNQQAIGKSKAALHQIETDAIDKSFKDQIDQADRSAKLEEENDKRAATNFKQSRQIEIEAARDAAQATIQAAQEDFTATQQQIRFQEQLGRISHRVALQRLADASLQKSGAVTGALGKEQSIFDPALGGKEAQQYQELQNKITAEARKGALERERVNEQEALKMASTYKRVAGEFNSDFTRAFNEWATRSQTAGNAFGHMLGTMELQVVDFVAKTILEQAEMWIEMEVLSAAGNASLIAQKQATGAFQRFDDAKTAAANAYAWASSWGGPVAGAIAAAVAFTAVESFEMGGIVGGYGPQMIQAHGGERVLSAGQTQNFESLVNNGGTRSATLHQENHFGGGVTQEMLDSHTQQTMQQLRSMLRPEAFA